MAFEEIVPQVTAARSGPEEVSLALYGKDEIYSVSIKIGLRVMQELGWQHGDRVVIGEGSGVDAGFLRLRRVPRGGYGLAVHNHIKGRPKNEFDGVIKCLRQKFVRYELPLEPHSQVAVPHDVQSVGANEKALLLLVPAWMKPASGADQEHYDQNRAKGLGGEVPVDSTSKAPLQRRTSARLRAVQPPTETDVATMMEQLN